MNPVIKESPKTKRESGFEALRILCILFIIAGHVIMAYDFKSDAMKDWYECAVRPLFMVAVNCFVLISGWFGIKTRWRRLLELNDCTTFWTVVIGTVAVACGLHEVCTRKDLLMLFPVVTRRFWFITTYVALCIVAPFLNVLVESLDEKRFRKMLVCLLCMFVCLPTLGAFLNFQSISGDSGYGLANFVTLYLLGRYMRIYRQPWRSAWGYLAMYLLAVITCGAVQVGFSKLMGFQFTTLLSYDTLFTFAGAVMLFCCFARIHFYSKFVNRVATFCYATYIIHLHPWIFSFVYNDLLGMRHMPDSRMSLCLVVLPIVTFAVCSLLEFFRTSAVNAVLSFVRNKADKNTQ